MRGICKTTRYTGDQDTTVDPYFQSSAFKLKRALCDRNKLAKRLYDEICMLFPDYREMHELAVRSLPSESLPILMGIPDFCLAIYDQILKTPVASTRGKKTVLSSKQG